MSYCYFISKSFIFCNLDFPQTSQYSCKLCFSWYVWILPVVTVRQNMQHFIVVHIRTSLTTTVHRKNKSFYANNKNYYHKVIILIVILSGHLLASTFNDCRVLNICHVLTFKLISFSINIILSIVEVIRSFHPAIEKNKDIFLYGNDWLMVVDMWKYCTMYRYELGSWHFF